MNLIDNIITKTGLTPGWRGTNHWGYDKATFRNGAKIARLSMEHDDRVYVAILREYDKNEEPLFIDSAHYKSAAAAAKYLTQRHGFTA